MKILLTLCLLGSLAVHGQTGKNTPLKMEGVYQMTKQVLNNSFTDQVFPTKQLKIYAGNYVMYAAPVSPTDSMASFGMGRYVIENGKVIEYFFYRADAGEQTDTSNLDIQKSDKGYKQVIVYPPIRDTVFTLTEEYEKIGKASKTPLDGVWKIRKSVYVNKKGDSSTNKITEFKVYRDGYFIWGAGFADSTGKNQGVYGYGNFTVNGNKLTETNTSSTYTTDLVNKPIQIDFKMTGNDEYMQTITHPTGEKTIEYFERMK